MNDWSLFYLTRNEIHESALEKAALVDSRCLHWNFYCDGASEPNWIVDSQVQERRTRILHFLSGVVWGLPRQRLTSHCHVTVVIYSCHEVFCRYC